jgi:hypothetical protein
MQKSTNSPTCRPNTKPSRRQRKRMHKKTQQGQLGPRQPSNFEFYHMQAQHRRIRLRKFSSTRAKYSHTRQLWSNQTHKLQQCNNNQLPKPNCQQLVLLVRQLGVQEQNNSGAHQRHNSPQHQCHCTLKDCHNQKHSHIIKRERKFSDKEEVHPETQHKLKQENAKRSSSQHSL